MRKISHFSNLGGEEIIQIRYPAITKNLTNYKVNADLSESNSLNTTIREGIIPSYNFKKLSSISKFRNAFLISHMESIPAFFKDSLIIYSPHNERNDFWLDMFTLNYLYPLKYFNVCLLILSGYYLSNNKIQYQELLKLLNERPDSLLHFPYECYIEEIK